MRKILTILTAAAVAILASVSVCAESGASESEFVTVSVEAFATGQGFVVEPTYIQLSGTQTAAEIIEQLVGAENLNNGAGAGTYVSSIAIDDTKTVAIPETTLNAITTAGGTPGTQATEGWLSAYDYYSMSGWMFVVNNESASVGMADYTVQNGDVIRLEFSLIGYGSDVGIDTSSMSEWGGMASLIPTTDRDALLELVARNAAELDEDILNSALNTLADLSSEQDELDTAAQEVTDSLSASDDDDDTTDDDDDTVADDDTADDDDTTDDDDDTADDDDTTDDDDTADDDDDAADDDVIDNDDATADGGKDNPGTGVGETAALAVSAICVSVLVITAKKRK